MLVDTQAFSASGGMRRGYVIQQVYEAGLIMSMNKACTDYMLFIFLFGYCMFCNV